MRNSCTFCGLAALDGQPCCSGEYRRSRMRDADKLIATLRSDLAALRGELRDCETAHGNALNCILELAAWSAQYHNGAPDCDCGQCRAKRFLVLAPRESKETT